MINLKKDNKENIDKNNNFIKKSIIFLKYIILILIVIFLILALNTRFNKKSNGIFGLKVYVIVSESMTPELKVGDIIITKKTESKDLKPNDIIAYQGLTGDFKNKIITHKIEYITKEANRYIYYTKGTANNTIDPAVYEEQIYGKMIYKTLILSYISQVVRTKIGFFLIVLIPIAIMCVIEIKEIKKIYRKINKKKRKM